MADSETSLTHLNEPESSSSLPRPRPKYFDPHRISGLSSSSSPSSSDSSVPPATPAQGIYTASPPQPKRTNFPSYASAGSIDSPFLGAGRPLSLPYEVRHNFSSSQTRGLNRVPCSTCCILTLLHGVPNSQRSTRRKMTSPTHPSPRESRIGSSATGTSSLGGV